MKLRSRTAILLIGVAVVALLLCSMGVSLAEPAQWYTSIFIKTYPNKMVYEQYSTFDPTGIVVYGNLQRSDGSTAQYQLGDGVLSYSPTTFEHAGTQTVTVTAHVILKSGSYGDLKTTFTVTVKEVEGDPPARWVNSICVKTKPDKVDYGVGDAFDPTGLVVVAKVTEFGENKSEKLKNSDLKFSPTKFKKAGDQKVTVSYVSNDSNGNPKTFTTTVYVTVYDALKITKHPTNEKVQTGKAASFIAHANYFTSCHWYFEKDGKVIDAKDAAGNFPGLSVSGISEEKLLLKNIPASLDGWSVYCTFTTPNKSLSTNAALITVTDANTPEPTEAAPTGTPTPTLFAFPADTPAAGTTTKGPTQPQATEHTHSFDGTFHADETKHWLECACGERSGEGEHVVVSWKTVKSSGSKVEVGQCIVCGSTVERAVAAEPLGLRGILLIVIGSFVLLTVPPLVIIGVVLLRKKK